MLFGDAEYVVYVETGADGLATRVGAVRATDGVKVDITDCRDLLKADHKLRTVGRHILAFEEDPAGGKVLRLYDPIAGKDVWRQNFAAGAVGLRPLGTDLSGVVEPNGTISVFDPDARKIVLTTTGGDYKAELRGHLIGVEEAYLLADADRYYMIFNKRPEAGLTSNPGLTHNFRSVRVNGHVYAFGRAKGDVEWYVDNIVNQHLLLDQFQEMPAMIFAAWTQKFDRNGVGQGQGRLQVIDKRDSKSILHPNLSDVSNAAQFHAMTLDPTTSTIELVRHDIKLRIVPESSPVAPPPNPAAQPGQPGQPGGG